MSDFLSSYAMDESLENAGVMVMFSETVGVQVRPIDNDDALKFRRKLEKAYLANKRAGTEIPDSVSEDILNKTLAKHVLVGWRGVLDPDTKQDLPFSEANALKILANKRLRRFRGDIITAAVTQQTFQAERDADIEGN